MLVYYGTLDSLELGFHHRIQELCCILISLHIRLELGG